MIHQAAGGNYVHRTWGDFPDNTGDWTVFMYFKYTNTPGATGAEFFDLVNFDDSAYLFVGSDHNTSNFFAELSNGSDTTDSATVSITLNNQNWFAVTYDSVTKIPSFYLNGVLLANSGSSTCDMSAIDWTELFIVGDDVTIASGNVSAAYSRAWSSKLTLAQLTAESLSITAVATSGLTWDCPLQTSVDLTSHNNTLNQLVAVGTVTTDTDDPLLSVVAGPPTNITANLATELFTNSAVYQDTITSGSSSDVWYKYTAVAGDIVIGVCGFGDLISHYLPTLRLFDGLADALANILYLNIVAVNTPVQFPVTVGDTYYFKFIPTGGVSSPALLQVSLLRGLNLPTPIGSIAINDDTTGFPLALLDSATGYPIRFINNFPVSEAAVAQPNGNVLTADEDDSTNGVKLYSPNYQTVVQNLTLTGSSSTKIATNNDKFLISVGAIHATMRLASDLAVLEPTLYTVGLTDSVWAIGLNVLADKAYFVGSGFNAPVKIWNLTTNTADSNLVAGIGADYANGKDILVMSNGAIIIPYTSDTNDKIIAYNAAGSVQHTYDFGVFSGFHNGQDNRVFSAVDEPNSFWAWIRYEKGLSRFFNIKYSDGSYLSNIPAIQFENGINQADQSNTPIRFGHSESCPSWITRAAIGVANNAKSGLYILTGTGNKNGVPDNPVLRHDVDWIDTSLGTSESVKIPDPYYDTYLVGDE